MNRLHQSQNVNPKNGFEIQFKFDTDKLWFTIQARKSYACVNLCAYVRACVCVGCVCVFVCVYLCAHLQVCVLCDTCVFVCGACEARVRYV